jgi:hypothetical protein
VPIHRSFFDTCFLSDRRERKALESAVGHQAARGVENAPPRRFLLLPPQRTELPRGFGYSLGV